MAPLKGMVFSVYASVCYHGIWEPPVLALERVAALDCDLVSPGSSSALPNLQARCQIPSQCHFKTTASQSAPRSAVAFLDLWLGPFAGASFFYKKGGPVPFEGQEVRSFGLLLNDLVQRLELPAEGACLHAHMGGMCPAPTALLVHCTAPARNKCVFVQHTNPCSV